MAKLLLDSDILIYFLKGNRQIVEQVAKHVPEDLLTSRINYTELLYGAYNSARVENNLRIILPFLENFEILEFDKSASEIFAKEKARLKKSGTLIADMDLMIASIAIANDVALVTNNFKHFERVKNLKLVRWVK
ncbi:PIN domain-containing protein [Hydrogenimonas thermophila]|uniref:PIN domain-containing protein n=1 Tax=Hydrogenimonas thermophila TaxID=223786 RepID=UPI0029374798|nr:PIN domain-containing protein [Hydrogenimonas thermophila]WOE69058.1 PIN domain-containing protein [Hydrogenimonas thermophila]WOE71568.1 PIN domain-containing protein [Hydrogenimonas thermophila]